MGVLGTAALLAHGSAIACESSHVYEKQDTYATKVKFDDLNLSRQAGAETLYKRLESAARRVCNSPQAESAYLGAARNAAQQCYSNALQRAVESVDNDHLTALHVERRGNHRRTGNELAAVHR